MSNLKHIAAIVPAEFRKEILELDMIHNAVASAGSYEMHYLGSIWKEYLDPNYEPVCQLCMGDCLKNWKALLPHLIELEQESKLLDSI